MTRRCGRVHTVDKCTHALETRTNFNHDILSIQHDRAITTVAQRGVERRPVLRGIDDFAGEHCLDPTLESSGVGEPNQ